MPWCSEGLKKGAYLSRNGFFSPERKGSPFTSGVGADYNFAPFSGELVNTYPALRLTD